MCHSVEMYLPQMTRHAAEARIGQADFAAAERERRIFGAGVGVMARFRHWMTGRRDETSTQEQVTHG